MGGENDLGTSMCVSIWSDLILTASFINLVPFSYTIYELILIFILNILLLLFWGKYFVNKT